MTQDECKGHVRFPGQISPTSLSDYLEVKWSFYFVVLKENKKKVFYANAGL